MADKIEYDPGSEHLINPQEAVLNPPDFENPDYQKRRAKLQKVFKQQQGIADREYIRVAIALYAKAHNMSFQQALKWLVNQINKRGTAWANYEFALGAAHRFGWKSGNKIALPLAWVNNQGNAMLAHMPLDVSIASRMYRNERQVPDLKPYVLKSVSRRKRKTK